MIVNILLGIIGVLNGGWMIFDGIHVLVKGKYFGPPEPGPWSHVVSRVGLDPMSLGMPFILFGVAWITSVCGVLLSIGWGWYCAVSVAIATLWYVPVGTVLALVFVGLLLLG